MVSDSVAILQAGSSALESREHAQSQVDGEGHGSGTTTRASVLLEPNKAGFHHAIKNATWTRQI